MNRILSQADQFPDRTAAVKRAIDLVPLAECVQNAATNKRSDRVDWRAAVDEDRPFTDEEHRHLRHLVELAGRITGAVIQPGDTGSGGPMFSVDDPPPFFGSAIDADSSAPPPANIADATAMPSADFEAQRETGTGIFNPQFNPSGMPIPPDPGGPGSGGGQFNPEIEIDTSMVTTSGPPV